MNIENFINSNKKKEKARERERERERAKNSKGTCKKLPATKGRRVGGDEEHHRLREPEVR